MMADNRRKKKKKSASISGKLLKAPIRKFGWLFMGPTMIAFAIGFIWPFLKGISLSFTRFKTLSDAKFLGFDHLFDNYIMAFEDPSFAYSFWYTTLFTLVTVILINTIAFLIAYVLTQGIKGKNIFRTIFFMPNLIGGIVLGYIWSMIFDGVLSRMNTSIMLRTEFGFWGLVILLCWQQIGYMMIIYIAALQTVSEDMLEAARIDGASERLALFRITIPNIMSSFTICIFLTMSNCFKLFDQNLALTAGQPFRIMEDGTTIKTTAMIALNIYSTFYGQGPDTRGTAQAKSVMFFILVAIIGIIQIGITKKREVE